MSSTPSKHCESTIYSSYKNCPDCGEKITNPPKSKNIESIRPDILSELKKYSTEAKLFTGKAIETFFYTRVEEHSDRNGTSSIEYAYCFLTLENEVGETIQVNINGEGDTASMIVVGDAVTLLDTCPLKIHLPRPKNIKNMINDTLIDAFIVHSKDGGQYSLKNMSNFFTPSNETVGGAFGTAFLTFIILAAAMFISWIFFDYPDEAIWGIPLISSVISFWVLISLIKSVGKLKEICDVYDKTVKDLLHITYQQLGYQFIDRVKSDDDVLCCACDERISNKFNYCIACGRNQNEAVVAIPNENVSTALESSDQCASTTSIAISDMNHPEITTSIKGKRLALMKAYRCSTPTETFYYKKLLGLTEKFTCSSEGQVYRVLNRTLYVKTKTSGYTRTTTKTYYSNIGLKVGEEETSYTNSKATIDLAGDILVEDDSGNIDEITVHPSIIGSLDAGDFLFAASQTIKHGNKKAETYRMTQYNLTKRFYIDPYDIRNYGEASFFEVLLILSAVAGAIATGIYFDEISRHIYDLSQYKLPQWGYHLENIALGVVVLLGFHLTRYPFLRRINKSNNNRAWKIVEPIFTTRNKAIDDNVVEKLTKYS